MYICIRDVLTGDQLSQLATLFERQSFTDGRKTAGLAGAGIKSNLQLKEGTGDYDTMRDIVTRAINENREFSLAAIPRHMRPVRFARYQAGMHYGRHVDNAVMGQNPPMRIDLSFTLFLSPPDTYEGGELVVEEPGARRAFKLPAGAMVLYPSNSLHRVAEVKSGNRDVAVGWLQSMVRDPEQRRILFELEGLRAGILAQSGRTAEFDTLSRNIAMLWHMWVEV